VLRGWVQTSGKDQLGSDTQVTIFGGYWAPGSDSWIRLDDVVVRRV
jgi:hypothetical protein